MKRHQQLTVVVSWFSLCSISLGAIVVDRKPRSPDMAARAAADQLRVMPVGETPPDARMGRPRDLADLYHPWKPASDPVAWQRQSQRIRTQVQVSQGLWPMPAKTPIHAVIHGKIDRDTYTVEKVYFASLPGHYVTGNLYRPKGKSGKLPAVLNPHGHWANGRFYDAGEKEAQRQIEIGAETFLPNARYPLQARMASLARLGAVVFHYDMIGVADNGPLGHGAGAGLVDVESELFLHSAMGLQTWNSIRALDFVTSLPDVDPARIGVTGASGGGTQTFMLCAVDERPAVAVPAVMVSSNMQGGCVCENVSHLRLGINNVAIAALFAPKPQALIACNDWTIDIETRGLPELRQVYKILQKPDEIGHVHYPVFQHNYNQRSREFMYEWMNRKLGLRATDTREKVFEPVPPSELSVFDTGHPRPADAKEPGDLRRSLTLQTQQTFQAIWPRDPTSLGKYKSTLRDALQCMIGEGLSEPQVVVRDQGAKTVAGIRVDRFLIARDEPDLAFRREAVPVVALHPAKANGRAILWVGSDGRLDLLDAAGAPSKEARRLLDAGYLVVAPDVFLTGEFGRSIFLASLPPVNQQFPGYTYTYNRTVFANRVHDILSALYFTESVYRPTSVDLVAFDQAGPWAILAKVLAGERFRRAILDFNNFSFATVSDPRDPQLLPGALRYGDLIGMACAIAPEEIYVRGIERLTFAPLLLGQAYGSARGGRRPVFETPSAATRDAAFAWILR